MSVKHSCLKGLMSCLLFFSSLFGFASTVSSQTLDAICSQLENSSLEGKELSVVALKCIEQLSTMSGASQPSTTTVPSTYVVQPDQFSDGWSPRSGYLPFQYSKLSDGTVLLAGMMSGCPSVKPVFQLPEDFRPKQTIIFSVMANDDLAKVSIDGEGKVYYTESAHWGPPPAQLCTSTPAESKYLSISGIQFIPQQ
jgi:hypothetical protein